MGFEQLTTILDYILPSFDTVSHYNNMELNLGQNILTIIIDDKIY